MTTKKTYKTILQLLGVFLLSCLVSILNGDKFSMLNFDNLITYVGAMLGFAITIYTFGIATIGQIKELILKNKDIKDDKKQENIDSLLYSFGKLKEDVWTITQAFIILLVFGAMESFKDINVYINDFLQQYKTVGNFNLYYTVKTFCFLLSTWMFIDLVRAMLSVSDILIVLTKADKPEQIP